MSEGRRQRRRQERRVQQEDPQEVRPSQGENFYVRSFSANL